VGDLGVERERERERLGGKGLRWKLKYWFVKKLPYSYKIPCTSYQIHSF